MSSYHENAIAERRFREICERWAKKGYDALSPHEKTWLNIVQILNSVQNGGVISYFYNTGADTLGDCLEDLKNLGAAEVRAQVVRVSGLFPGGVSADRDERNQVINSWEEREDYDLIEELISDATEVLMPLMADLDDRLGKYLHDSGLIP